MRLMAFVPFFHGSTEIGQEKRNVRPISKLCLNVVRIIYIKKLFVFAFGIVDVKLFLQIPVAEDPAEIAVILFVGFGVHGEGIGDLVKLFASSAMIPAGMVSKPAIIQVALAVLRSPAT